jgi:hypothetical protein
VRPFDGSLVFMMTVGIGCANNGGGSSEILHDCKMECSIASCTIKVST